MAKHPDRTILVELGPLRPFSDISGINVIRLDDSPEKRNALVERLATAGCPVSRTGGDWLSAGDFNGTLASLQVGSSQASVDSAQESASTSEHGLSDNAVQLLVEASKDSNGIIRHVRTFGGLYIETNNIEFVEPRNPRSEAAWRAALVELENLELVEDRGGQGELFRITQRGFEIADLTE